MRWTANQFLGRLFAVLGAFFLLLIAMRLGRAYGFSIQGGEFHAMYRHIGLGRTRLLLQIYGLYLASLGIGAGFLVLMRYPLRWSTIGGLSALIGVWSWLRILPWSQKTELTFAVAKAGLLAMPLAIFAASYAAQRLRDWIDQR